MKAFTILFASAALLVSCQEKKAETTAVLLNDIDSVSYALGVNIGETLKKQGAGDLNFEIMKEAAMASYGTDTNLLMDGQASMAYLNGFFQRKQQELAQTTLKEGQEFLAENAKKAGIVSTGSGLQYEVMKSGSGSSPGLQDKILVHYIGTFIDGTVFESTYDFGKPAEYQTDQMIKGWQEALPMMKEGDKWKLFIPAELGFGSMGGGKIPANSALIFELELLQVNPTPQK
jgi:FKBP-type peptidyl-prolyl cis-trans isomerase